MQKMYGCIQSQFYILKNHKMKNNPLEDFSEFMHMVMAPTLSQHYSAQQAEFESANICAAALAGYVSIPDHLKKVLEEDMKENPYYQLFMETVEFSKKVVDSEKKKTEDLEKSINQIFKNEEKS